MNASISRREHQRRYRIERIAKGLCPVCSKPADRLPKHLCSACADKMKFYYVPLSRRVKFNGGQ